jgi:SnoaL-like domain
MSMPLELPPAIDRYVEIENAGNTEALSECFAADATVRDESNTYVGIDAIKRWKADTKKRYGHTVHPLSVSHRDGKTVLTARLTGNFPSSPVTLEFSFVVEGGKITALQIQ